MPLHFSLKTYEGKHITHCFSKLQPSVTFKNKIYLFDVKNVLSKAFKRRKHSLNHHSSQLTGADRSRLESDEDLEGGEDLVYMFLSSARINRFLFCNMCGLFGTHF